MQPVGSFRPDMADTNPGVARTALNVIIKQDGNGVAHGPMPGLNVTDTAVALPDEFRGGTSALSSSGNYSAFIGTKTNLYKMNSAYQLGASQSVGSGYGVPDGDHWSFARFGANLFATNKSDGMQSVDVDSDASFSAVSDAPSARYAFPAFNAVFALDCDGENRVMRNSAIGNALIWEGKGAGYQVFENGGELIAGAELSPDFAIVLQRNAINGLYRTGTGDLYQRKLIANDRGAVAPQAFCSVDGRAFWVDTDGVWMYSVGDGLKNIGYNRINKTFLSRLVTTGALNAVQLAVDKVNTRIAVSYRRSYENELVDGAIGDALVDPFDESNNDLFLYDYLLDEWSEAAVQHSAIMSMASPGYTTDSIDHMGPLDGIDLLIDSSFFRGGEPQLAALDALRRFGFFNGANLRAVTEAASQQSEVSVLVTSVTPLTDAAAGTLGVGVRDRASDAIDWKTGVAMKPSGRVPVRGRGKLISYRFSVPAGETWTYLRGFDAPVAAKGGAR